MLIINNYSSSVSGLNCAGFSLYGYNTVRNILFEFLSIIQIPTFRQAGHNPFSSVRIRCQQNRQI